MSDVPPIRREVTVDADLATSFEIFTSGIDRWWPIDLHSVHGAGGNVTFVDGQLVEQSAEGEISLWGTVTKWNPPTVVAFTWHPGTDEQRASRVEVTFTPLDSQTLVVLEHSGWETFGDPAAARDEYDHGWPEVLGRYKEEVAQSNGHTWVALLHSPGAPRTDGRFTVPRRTIWPAPGVSRSHARGGLSDRRRAPERQDGRRDDRPTTAESRSDGSSRSVGHRRRRERGVWFLLCRDSTVERHDPGVRDWTRLRGSYRYDA
jgi:prepilin-type processing-associated H-X9-DG protein